MERKIAPPDMISMSRSSRDNRAPKNPKFTSDTTASNKSSSASKKSQIRATGTSRSATSASKKANTGGDGVAGVSGASKKSENGLSHIGKISSVPLRTVLRSKRAAETETSGDVTLDALRPVKKQKISNDRGKVKGLKNDAGNGRHSAGSTDTSVAPTKASSDLGERNSGTGVSSINIIASPPVKLNGRGVTPLQIGTRNGLSRVDKRKEQRALRPRPTATAPEVKKRTRFHEVTLGEGDGPRIVGRRIKVFWPLEKKYFYGHVKSFNGSRKLQHRIVYDDKDEEWLRLQNEVFRIELLSGEVFGGKAPAPGTEANTVTSVADNSADHTADVGEGDTRELADARSVEASGQGRIKPEGVYRRKRRAERASEEMEELLEHEKKSDAEGEPKKKVKGDGELKSKVVGDDELKQLPEGRTSLKVREVGNQQRGTLAERFGRMNAKWASGNSVTRDRRKIGLQAVTSRDLRMKGLTSDSSNARRKRAGKDKVSRGSSIQTRLRHSIAAEKDGKKAQRRRIRDDDWLFASVKTSSAVIRRKVAESKKSKEGKTSGRISEDNNVSRQTRKTEKIAAAQGEILVGDISRSVMESKGVENPPGATQGVNLVGNVSRSEIESEDVENSSVAIQGVNLVGSISRNVIESKDLENVPAAIQGVNLGGSISRSVIKSNDVENAPLAIQGVTASGPYEAVMDIYREALSGANDESGTTEMAGIEKLSSVALRFEVGTSAECDSRGPEDATVEILRQSSQCGRRCVEGVFLQVPQVTSGNGNAAPAIVQVDENRQQIADEFESNMRVRGGEEMDVGDQPESLEALLVVPPLIPPITLLGSEFQLAPDEVYRRLNKYQPDKVYRRLKHSRVKGNNEELGEQVYLQHWVLARALTSASNVFICGPRIAALGFSLSSFDRIAFSMLRCRSSTDDGRFQLSAFYGAPSMLSLLRVSWKSLEWLLAATSVSMKPIDDTSSGGGDSSVSNMFRSTNQRFKRRRVSCIKSRRHVRSLRQLLDPTIEFKCQPSSIRHSRGHGERCRSRGFVVRSSLVIGAHPGALASFSQALLQRHASLSRHLSPPYGQIFGDLYPRQLVVSSGLLKRSPLLSHSWINRWSASTENVDNIEAALSPLFTVSEERDTSSQEVGAYYGEPSLRSFLRVAGADVGEMNRGETQLSGSALNSRITATNASLRAAGNDSSNLACVGPLGSESRHDEIPSSFLIYGDDGSALKSQDLRSVFMDSWATSILAAYFRLSIRDYGRYFPRLCSCQNCLRLKAAFPVYVLATRSFGGLADPEVAARQGFGLCTGSQMTQSVPEAVSTYCAEGPGSEQEVGQHYGPPSVESILRVSKEFWLWLLVGRWKARHSINVLPAAPVVPIVEDAGAPPPSQCPELSSFVTVDDDDLSDQDDRIQVMSSTRREADDSYVGSPDAGVIGDGFQSGLKPIESVLSVKKGRRTGKGFKRGFVQMSKDSFQKDSVGFDSVPDGDDSAGRPHYKRTRVETESTGGACNIDNGVDASPPSSSLEGKGVSAPSVLLQERTKGSILPRGNVLKLRRCPTNKGLWLVAGNSYTASQCKGARVAGVEVDSSVSLDREPMTPNFETGKKRVLDQFLESPQLGRSDHGEPNADCSSDSQERETSALGMKSAKAFSLHTKSREVWIDCGIASVNRGVADGLEIRKRRRKGISPTTGDDFDVFPEHSMRRAPDAGWGACIANLLVTESDRCVRETGAIVELQTGHDGSCMLLVCLHGQSKYAHKADQSIAAGNTNKFTHSMMWRGGKAWSLEFVDRKQWQLFKDLHEECFQRNARAALVRHIPIPVSKSIQEIEKLGHRFIRPPLEYIQQLDGEVEMALKSSRIMYDMDSEDEDWLSQTNNEQVSARGVVRSRSRISDETLEGVIDRLERNSFIRNHTPFSAEIATELCQPLGSPDVIKAIYSYWLEKRRQKRMALIRHFQPAPWEQYQRQMQEWQAKVDQLQHLSPTASKEELEASFKRPPLFAFCLRPRGLEGRNKMQKQRSQRKQGLGGSSSRQWTLAGPPSDFFSDSPSKRLSTLDSPGGPSNGSRKFAHQRSQEDAGSTMAVDLSESLKTLTTGRITSLGEAGQGVAQRASTPVETSTLLRYQTSVSGAVVNKRSKKLGRKAKKIKLIAAAEDSRLKGLNGTYTNTVASPHSLEIGHSLVESIPSTSGISVPKFDEEEEDDDVIIARAVAADAFAKTKRESASSLRSRAQALYAVADAAMHEAVAAVITADAIHAAERTVDEASVKEQGRVCNTENHRQQPGEGLAFKYDTAQARGSGEATRGGSSFGSWRRALKSASKSANHVLSKGSSSKSGIIADTDDPLLPVASWSQELGAGLGTRLLQTGDVGPRQRYSPVLVEGISKSPSRGGRGDRGDGLVSLGRTRGESMMAMLTR